MKQVLQYPRKDGLAVEEVPFPGCKPQGIIVDNRISLISAGTERAIIDLASKSLAGKAYARPDLVRQVLGKIKSEGLFNTLNKLRSRLNTPIPLGYSSSGVIAEVGDSVHNFAVGDRVACAGFGYACHANRIYVPANLAVALPSGLSHEEGSFVTLGAIALWGVRQSGVTLGDRVAVIGLGLLGQLTAQILTAAGCQVIGLDIDQERLAEVERFNIDIAINSGDAHAEKAVRQFTDGRGVDAVLITAATSSNQPLELAAAICRDRGKITVIGNVKMDLPRKPFYEKELTINLSRSYGPGRYDLVYEEQGIDYPYGFVRWTENRNMQSFLELVATGKVDLKPLMTTVYDIADADQAFQMVTARRVLGVLLKYPEICETRSINISTRSTTTPRTSANVGFLGAGSFATGVLLPALKRAKGYSLTKLYSTTPHKARFAADQFGFSSVAESEEEIYLDPNIDLIFIATPHNCHARQVLKGLQAGKSVFVEKPLCLTITELEQIASAYSEYPMPLTVGFNRRYSTCARKIKALLDGRHNPLMFNYIVNAGFIPKENPLHDDNIGGGRIIGETCHFIDLIAHLTSSTITRVQCNSVSQQKGNFLLDDNIVISLSLSDGSTGTITYTALGDKSFPKEILHIFVDGSVLSMSDFKSLELNQGGRQTCLYRGAMDKGFNGELERFLKLHLDGQPPMEAETYFHSSLVSIMARTSLKTGQSLTIAARRDDHAQVTENSLS